MSSDAVYLRTGDLEPALELTLTDETGARVDLANAAAVTLVVVRQGEDEPTVDEAMTVDQVDDDPDTHGDVSYAWASGNTDLEGNYRYYVRVTWPGAKQQTFPSRGTMLLVIADRD
ncbi:MAG: hypothetical protein AB7I24_08170 [Candidatus Nanopelagicales bacterium]